ncbi:MAG TPA: carbon storage regulator, partial [Pirellulaceae bacterium]|nr:carbon storage regulator [Pirellulaceae bacterium]
MLVLSRRPNEKIVFPNLGISIEVLRVAGNLVKIGVDAPPEVRILREELVDDQRAAAAPVVNTPNLRTLRHALRNELNNFSLGLHLAQRHMELGEINEAEQTMANMLESLKSADDAVARLDAAIAASAKTITCRALLVEDDANESQLLAAYLRSFGIEVTTVTDGVAALEYLATSEHPDLVLLDMNMPRLGGKETVEKIRQDPTCRNLKIFAVSGERPSECG